MTIQEAKDTSAKQIYTKGDRKLENWEDAISEYCKGYLSELLLEKIIDEAMQLYASQFSEFSKINKEQIKEAAENYRKLNEIHSMTSDKEISNAFMAGAFHFTNLKFDELKEYVEEITRNYPRSIGSSRVILMLDGIVEKISSLQSETGKTNIQ